MRKEPSDYKSYVKKKRDKSIPNGNVKGGKSGYKKGKKSINSGNARGKNEGYNKVNKTIPSGYKLYVKKKRDKSIPNGNVKGGKSGYKKGKKSIDSGNASGKKEGYNKVNKTIPSGYKSYAKKKGDKSMPNGNVKGGKSGYKKGKKSIDGGNASGKKEGYNKDNKTMPSGYKSYAKKKGDKSIPSGNVKGKETYNNNSSKNKNPSNAKGINTVRINRFIAQTGICSRRDAEALVLEGKIKVNGNIIDNLSTRINPSIDSVTYKGKTITTEKQEYILLNKPKGYITTMEDTHERRIVIDLISKELVHSRVYPVGRLDRKTTGVLLLTNDGELAKVLIHPSSNVSKVYRVTLDKPLTAHDMSSISKGFDLDDGKVEVDDIAYIDDSRNHIGIELHSGRNRIVRRIFEHFGYSVTGLDRVYFAGLTKKGVKRGHWRRLDEKEVRVLKHFSKVKKSKR